MLEAYLQPETLTGDNKYKCNKCASLQDAERSLRITAGPTMPYSHATSLCVRPESTETH